MRLSHILHGWMLRFAGPIYPFKLCFYKNPPVTSLGGSEQSSAGALHNVYLWKDTWQEKTQQPNTVNATM